jgi:hypothetical protein
MDTNREKKVRYAERWKDKREREAEDKKERERERETEMERCSYKDRNGERNDITCVQMDTNKERKRDVRDAERER